MSGGLKLLDTEKTSSLWIDFGTWWTVSAVMSTELIVSWLSKRTQIMMGRIYYYEMKIWSFFVVLDCWYTQPVGTCDPDKFYPDWSCTCTNLRNNKTHNAENTLFRKRLTFCNYSANRLICKWANLQPISQTQLHIHLLRHWNRFSWLAKTLHMSWTPEYRHTKV